MANARYVITVPQSLMETEPEVVRIIKEAEAANPAPGPFRIHRMPQWTPPFWYSEASADRVGDFVTWERETIQPKYGITLGVNYTHTIGVAEIYDYEWFFGGFPCKVWGETVRNLGIASGTRSRLLPPPQLRHVEHPLLHPSRVSPRLARRIPGIRRVPARDGTDLSSALTASTGPGGQAELKDWVETHDYQIRRNRQMYPRAWVVHDATWAAPHERPDPRRAQRADARNPLW